MCRSIKTLRPPYTDEVTADDMAAAALQYVRKIAGMRQPSRANQAAFEQAVRDVTAATDQLLASLTVGPARPAGAARSGRREPARAAG